MEKAKNILNEILNEIKADADEVLKKEQKSDLEFGQLLAYSEALSIIRDAYSAYDLKDIGLDFDIDERYLITRKQEG